MSLPISLTGRYQLVFIAAEGDAWVDEHISRLNHALSLSFIQLGVDIKKFLIQLFPDAHSADLNHKIPTVAVFFGSVPSPRLSSQGAKKLDRLLADGTLIIPVVPETAEFGSFVPEVIAGLNGVSFSDCGEDFERLSARILEGFGLLRERRRLFISYRRVDTSSVASQLYEALDSAGFDVFLDTHGVLRPGEPFQDVLWHRLADTDVAIILDSPGFIASRWTEEELARVNTANIQILQLLWPGQTEGSATGLSVLNPLTDEDFVGRKTIGLEARLIGSSVATIVDAVEGLRARAMGARFAFLVREFTKESREAGLKLFTTLERALIVTGREDQRLLVVPAIGVPDAERYEELVRLQERESSTGRSYIIPPILLYDHVGIRDSWLKHLHWLNNNLACARSVSLQEARRWISDMMATGKL